MKNLCVRTLLAAFLAVAALTLHAESGARIVFNVPFSFIAGGQTLPAGVYELSETDSHVLTIESLNRQNVSTAVVYNLSYGRPTSGAVNFTRRAGIYYLDTVRLGDGRTVRLRETTAQPRQ